MAAGFWNKIKNFGKKVWNGVKTGAKAVAGAITSVNQKVSDVMHKVPGIGKVIDKIPLMGTITKAADSINSKVNNWANG